MTLSQVNLKFDHIQPFHDNEHSLADDGSDYAIEIVLGRLSWEQGFQVAKRAAADIVSIKLAKAGGLFRGKKVAAVCEAAGMPCYADAMWASGMGSPPICISHAHTGRALRKRLLHLQPSRAFSS